MQLENAPIPIEQGVAKYTDLKFEQFMKVLVARSTQLGKLISDKFAHPENAALEVRAQFGISMLIKLTQL